MCGLEVIFLGLFLVQTVMVFLYSRLLTKAHKRTWGCISQTQEVLAINQRLLDSHASLMEMNKKLEAMVRSSVSAHEKRPA